MAEITAQAVIVSSKKGRRKKRGTFLTAFFFGENLIKSSKYIALIANIRLIVL